MYFEEIELNTEIELDSALITRERMMSFAGTYDNIPLHTDEDYAKNTRFGAIIAPGVMSFMVMWAKYLEKDITGEELLAGKSTSMEWLKPVYAGDVLSGKAVVTKLEKHGKKSGVVTLSFWIYNQKNELVLTNESELVVKCRE